MRFNMTILRSLFLAFLVRFVFAEESSGAVRHVQQQPLVQGGSDIVLQLKTKNRPSSLTTNADDDRYRRLAVDKYVRNDTNLREATALWFDNQIEADARYGHISSWNTSAVTDMSSLFSYKIYFNDDISRWDVGSSTSFASMFFGAAAFNGDISSWEVGSSTNFEEMFLDALVFNGDLSSWDVGSSESFAGMFTQAYAFNGDISSWEVGSSTSFRKMFTNAAVFDGDLSSWDVGSSVNIDFMFVRSGFTGKLCWNTTEGTDMFTGSTDPGELLDYPECLPSSNPSVSVASFSSKRSKAPSYSEKNKKGKKGGNNKGKK